ncbi:hypothetical protein CsSME_00015045 [Camellia sinensis var. sinensis]
MANTTELRQVEPTVWKACAGTSVQIPTVDSRVYYFPQGHAEQASSPPFLSPLVSSQPLILCRVAAVLFLANSDTDEVFAKIRLLPLLRSPNPDCSSRGGDVDVDVDEDAVVSFAKILTPSDANNGGGFSVPRFCADSIFPPLNFAADPPVQTLSITDVHGVVWEFRHIYRGTPRRHLLTTGWSKFVNHKKLIAGDSVVFMRNRRSGDFFIGVRRAVRSNADCGGRWNSPVGSVRVKTEEDGNRGKEGFSRNGKGRVSAESVSEAAELAAQGMGFEVVYYPRVGWADFVVKAETVEESLSVFWTAGVRVKMGMETEDSSRMTWFQGTVSSVTVPDNGPWRGSPWRMLQVTWDEPEVLQNVKRVNPWQVEYVVPTPPIHSTYPPAKKLRFSQNSVLPTDGEGDLFFPITGLNNSMIRNLNPSLMNYNSFPAGMQGARQDPFCVSSLSNFTSENNHHMCGDKLVGNNMTPKLKTVSTELNIGSSQTDNLSPDSQSSVHFFGNDLVGKQGCNSSTKVSLGSFQLFGKIIHTKDPVENGFDDAGCTEDKGCKMFKEADGMKNSLDLSLTCPYTNLLDGLDVQCQRASAVEACSL